MGATTAAESLFQDRLLWHFAIEKLYIKLTYSLNLCAEGIGVSQGVGAPGCDIDTSALDAAHRPHVLKIGLAPAMQRSA